MKNKLYGRSKQRKPANKNQVVVSKIATLAMHGIDESVEYTTVAIHIGSKVLDKKVFYSKDYDGDMDRASDDILHYTASHGVKQIKQVSSLLPPEQCPCCDEPMVRIADGGPGHRHNS